MTSDLGDITLTRGNEPKGEGMSIAEAVAAFAGERLRQPTERPRCASRALMEWLVTWADRLADDDRQQLRRYILPLTTSRGTDEEEVARIWLVLDWLIRTDGPLWLHGARLPRQAGTLAALRPVRNPETFADAHPAVRSANKAARRVSEGTWLLVAQDARVTIVPAQPHHAGIVPVVDLGSYEPAKNRRLEAWAALADATTSALQHVETLIDCATNAAGYRAATHREIPDGLQGHHPGDHPRHHRYRLDRYQGTHYDGHVVLGNLSGQRLGRRR